MTEQHEIEKDVMSALMFFREIDDGIVLVYRYEAYAPVIKRILRFMVGEPDSMVGNRWRYGQHYIHLTSLIRESHIRGFRPEQLFYVGEIREEDELHE